MCPLHLALQQKDGEWMYVYIFQMKMWKCINMCIHNVYLLELFPKLKKLINQSIIGSHCTK